MIERVAQMAAHFVEDFRLPGEEISVSKDVVEAAYQPIHICPSKDSRRYIEKHRLLPCSRLCGANAGASVSFQCIARRYKGKRLPFSIFLDVNGFMLQICTLVIDSLAFHLRHSFEDPGARARATETIAMKLHELAREFRIVA